MYQYIHIYLLSMYAQHRHAFSVEVCTNVRAHTCVVFPVSIQMFNKLRLRLNKYLFTKNIIFMCNPQTYTYTYVHPTTSLRTNVYLSNICAFVCVFTQAKLLLVPTHCGIVLSQKFLIPNPSHNNPDLTHSLVYLLCMHLDIGHACLLPQAALLLVPNHLFSNVIHRHRAHIACGNGLRVVIVADLRPGCFGPGVRVITCCLPG